MNGDPITLTEDGAQPARANPARAQPEFARPDYGRPDYGRSDYRRPGYGGGNGALGMGEIWRTLKRRWLMILLVTILGLVIAAFAVFQITPRYDAASAVMLDQRKNNVFDFNEVISGLQGDDDTVNSEILVIRSPVLVGRVINRLNLVNDPEFNQALRPKGGGLNLNLAERFGRTPPPAQTEEALLQIQHSRVVEAVQEQLTVARAGRSRAINIRFVSTRPATAAKVVNALADTYLADQLAGKFQATNRAQDYLDARVGELRQQVQQAEQAIEAYRARAGLVGTAVGTVASQQLSLLNTQLVLAQTQKAEAEARLRQIQQLTSGSGNGAESAIEVLASPLIVDLRGRETEAERKIAELSQEYGEKHPRMISARAEFRDIQTRIRGEVAKIVSSLENEVAVAQARQRSLTSSVRQLEQTAARQGADEVQLRALEREAEAARRLFEHFITRASETSSQADVQRPDARILARADIPTAPTFPKPGIILPIAGLLALFAGIALALLMEQLDRGYRSGEEIEQQLGAGVLALVPQLSKRLRLTTTPENYVLDKPISSFAEALRSVDTGVRLSNIDAPPKSVLITSSMPKEGKTTLAMAWARMLAKSGRKVLLIDADLRRPRVTQVLSSPKARGLVDVLSDGLAVAEAIQIDQPSGLHLLPAGHEVASPPEMLGSDQMAQLLRALEADYDLVLIDSAPVLVVSDSWALAHNVDAVVFVVRWASTRREVVANGLKQMREASAKLAGVVLSGVNVRRHARYGYGDSGYYSGAASKYYRN
jgi:polysaccharide biosynthesis transport protein